jgi:hypothetical protein
MLLCVFLFNVWFLEFFYTQFFISTGIAEQIAGPSTGYDSLDRKNRKKRAAKARSPDMKMSKLVIDEYVEAFYSKYMRRQRFKGEDEYVCLNFFQIFTQAVQHLLILLDLFILSICSASFYSYLLFSYFLIFCCQPYFH